MATPATTSAATKQADLALQCFVMANHNQKTALSSTLISAILPSSVST